MNWLPWVGIRPWRDWLAGRNLFGGFLFYILLWISDQLSDIFFKLIIWISRRIPNQSRNYINPWSGVQVGMIYETKVEECCVFGRILTWTAPRPADSVLVPTRSCPLVLATPTTTATSRPTITTTSTLKTTAHSQPWTFLLPFLSKHFW